MKMLNQMAFINRPLAFRPPMPERTNFGPCDVNLRSKSNTHTHMADAAGHFHTKFKLRRFGKKNKKYIIRTSERIGRFPRHRCRHVCRWIYSGMGITCELNYLCDKQINMDHSFIHFLYVMQAHHTHTHAAIATDSEPRLNVFFSVFLGIRARGRGRANTRCGGEIRNEKKSRPIDGENKTTPKIQHIHFFSLAKNNVSEGRRDEVEIGPFDARLVHFIYRPLPPPPPSLPLLCK